MNTGMTSIDKAWVPLAAPIIGILVYHNVLTPEQGDSLTPLIMMGVTGAVQAVLVLWKKNKET